MKEQLREAIRRSGKSLNQLGQECGIGADRLSRFMRGERGLGLDAADIIFQTLRLEIKLPPLPEGDDGA